MTRKLQKHDKDFFKKGILLQNTFHERKSMSFKKIFFVIIIGTLFLTSVGGADVKKDYIQQIHTQFLTTDFKKEEAVKSLMLSLRKALEIAQSAKPEDEVAMQNLLKLYDKILLVAQKDRFPKGLIEQAKGQVNLEIIFDKLKSYQQEQGKVIPTGWSLPKEFVTLVVGVDRKLNAFKNNPVYSFGLYGWLQKGSSQPEQVFVQRFSSGSALLNKEKNIGLWSDGLKWSKPKFSFDFWSDESTMPPAEGLYVIDVKMKDQAKISGWFILRNMSVNESPKITSPYLGEVYKSAHLVVNWKNYISSQFQGFESRKRSLKLWNQKEKDQNLIWRNTQICPDNSEKMNIEVATDNDGHDSVKIENGNYIFQTDFQERWFFGDLLMQRSATTKVPFSVRF